MDVYGFVSRLLVLAIIASAVLFAVCRPPQPESGETEPAATVTARPADQGTQFANIVVTSENKVSLERAYLLVNGEKRGSFAAGQLTIRVYDGDILAADCRAYGRELNFTVDLLSSSIDPDYLPAAFSCREEVFVFGFAVIRQL